MKKLLCVTLSVAIALPAFSQDETLSLTKIPDVQLPAHIQNILQNQKAEADKKAALTLTTKFEGWVINKKRIRKDEEGNIIISNDVDPDPNAGPDVASLPDMTAAKTALPDIQCSITNTNGEDDVGAALLNLRKYIQPTEQCKDAKLENINTAVGGMQSSWKSIQTQWESTEEMSKDPSKIKEFENNMSTFVQSMTSILSEIKDTEAVSSSCGRQMMDSAGFLSAISRVASAAMPIATLAASLNPAWAVGLKAAMSVVGVGSILSGFKDKEKGIYDMSKVDNRQALLQNLCEYSKIEKRLQVIRRAERKSIADVTAQIKKDQKEISDFLANIASPDAKTLNDYFQNTFMPKWRHDREALTAMTAEIRNLEASAKSMNQNALCSLASDLAIQTNAGSGPVYNMISFLNGLISNQSFGRPADTQKALLKAEADLRTQVSTMVTTEVETCEPLSKKYLESIGQITDASQLTLTAHKDSILLQLRQNAEFSQLYQFDDKARKDSDELQRLSNAFFAIKKSKSSSFTTDIAASADNLKMALFGGYDEKIFESKILGFFTRSKDSPVYSWLSAMNTVFNRFVSSFDHEVKNLLVKATDFKYEVTGQPRFVTVYTMDGGGTADITIKEKDLKFVTPKNAPEASEDRALFCRYLEAAQNDWSNLRSSLIAQDQVCKHIRQLFEDKVQTKIKDFCGEKARAANSNMARAVIKLAEKGYVKQFEMVKKKYEELHCDEFELSF